MKKILELLFTFSFTGLVITIYTFYLQNKSILELQEQIARMTLPTDESNLEDTYVDSDFDERIREMTEELEKLNVPGTLYDLPHASVRTPSKFSPEYAD